MLPATTAVLLAGLGSAVVLQPVPTRAAAPAVRVAAPTVALVAALPVPTTPVPVAEAAAEVGQVAARTSTSVRAAPAAPARGTSAPPLTLQQRGQLALASLDFTWRSLGYDVAFRPYTGGTLGTASSRTRTVTVYVKQRQDETELRATIAHEIGHALDDVHATNERRAQYRRIRGLSPSGSWFPCSGCEGLLEPGRRLGRGLRRLPRRHRRRPQPAGRSAVRRAASRAVHGPGAGAGRRAGRAGPRLRRRSPRTSPRGDEQDGDLLPLDRDLTA